ncbi:Latex clearing protein precursor [compost metagenome]
MNNPSRYKLNTTSFKNYWEKGIGVSLLKKLETKPDLKDAERLAPYLFEFDDQADDLVHQLHQKMGFVKGQQLVDDYISGKNIVDKEPENQLKTFFDDLDTSPSWLDLSLLKLGSEFSQRSGISGLIVLRDYCLMGGYESAAINKPLIYTGALKKGAAKRLTDTTEFWVDITGNDALLNNGIGFKAIIKTRMIHSFSRINILKLTDWDSNKLGAPLNQWDMLATNLGFSLVYLVGLRRLGFKPNENEVKGLFHFWKYIGYLLGIPLKLLPNTEEEAIELLYYWTMTQPEGDEDTIALAKALYEEPILANYPTTKFGRQMMQEFHLFYNYYLLGDYSCNLLQLRKTFTGKIAYLNVLKNKLQARNTHKEHYRKKAIVRGRAEHLEVKRIYLTYNSK